ncbi:MAG: PhnE/PtxC family ABC transporter permease, partial [Candidatus Competibacterales bacterium]
MAPSSPSSSAVDPLNALPPRDLKRSIATLVGWALFAVILVWSWDGAEMRPWELVRGADNMVEFLSGFTQPDFRQWRYYFDEMLVTVQIAVWGTLLAVVLSIPFGILSSENVVPWWVYFPVRRLMDAFRAINELVFALVFIVAVGLGPFAGVMALFVHTTGILAKLFSEAVEAIDPRPVEGIRATGATPIQEVVYGI